ncbi:AaceriADL398Cp [[Ashbya] aceris (nom. inval.)]|nr:AaceriADL398Cp [[Ashbya] aceris (nom. inval.)]
MKFISSIFLGAAALANMALADSEEFQFLGVRSASKFHFSSVHAEDGALKLGGKGEPLSAVITDNGKLRLSDGKYAVVTAAGPIVEGSEEEGSAGFSIAAGYLKYAGNSAFVPISVGDSYELSVRPIDPSEVAISIRAQSKTNIGAVAADFLAHL